MMKKELMKPLIKFGDAPKKQCTKPLIKYGKTPPDSLTRPLIKYDELSTEQNKEPLDETNSQSQVAGDMKEPNIPARMENTIVGDATPATVSDSVYKPKPMNSNKYTLPAKQRKSASDIANSIVNSKLQIKTLEGKFYVFNHTSGVYEYCSMTKVYHLIEAIVKGANIAMDSSGAYTDVVNYLKYDHGIAVYQNQQLPGNRWAFQGCIVDIYTKQVFDNDGSHFITSALTCTYNPYAECPTFDNFLSALSGNDSDIIELIWQIIGYVLSTDVNAKNFFTFIGPKDTGKSLLTNIITAFFSASCVSDFGGRFTLAELEGKRVNICADLTDEIIPLNAVGKIKSVTGGDSIRSDRKYREATMFQNTAKLIFATNHPLKTAKQDAAFADRQIVVPFLYPVPKEKQDLHLKDKVMTELSGIANKAMQAYQRLVSNNYIFPQISNQLPEGLVYSDEAIIGDFIKECCDFSDSSAKVSSQDIFNLYENFCMRIQVQAISDIKVFSTILNRMIGSLAEKKKVNIDGKILQGYVGIKLK